MGSLYGCAALIHTKLSELSIGTASVSGVPPAMCASTIDSEKTLGREVGQGERNRSCEVGFVCFSLGGFLGVSLCLAAAG